MMRARAVLLGLLLCVATAAQAAPHPFYAQMLQRGIASAHQGRDVEAGRELKVAAFGLLNDLPTYQKAQMYLAVVNERLARHDDARIAAVKFLQAERISEAFATLDVPSEVRAEFEKVAASAADPEYLASIPSFRRSAPREVAMVASNSKESALGADAPAPPAKPAPQQSEVPAPPTKPAPQQSEVPAPPTKPAPQRVSAPAPVYAQPETVVAPSRAPIQKPEFGPRIATALRLIDGGQRSEARQALLALTSERDLQRNDLLAVAEGLNRVGAWGESSEAYGRARPWADGDEHHVFLEAVNRYEMGERQTARELLDRVLPKLPPSRELAIYRGMIEAGSRLP
ncbi:MAG: hypothetical protein WA208_12865 [Thermoanaerobaculia bacterium]